MPATWFRWLSLGTLLTCAPVLLESRAHAADAAATTAREHYERGTKLYDIGKYEEAIKEFEAAYEAKSDPALLYNLAQSHRLAGHSSEALQLYRNYLRYVPHAANRVDIEERIKTLEKTVAERSSTTTPPATTTPAATTPATTATTPVTTSPPAGQPGAQDPGSPQATGAWPPPSDPNYPYQQPQPGAYPQQPPGAYPQQPAGAYPAPSPGAPVVAPAGHRNAGIALCAVGGGLIVTGAIFGLVAKNQAKKVEDAAHNGDPFDPSVESLGRTSVVLQWIGYGIGAAALVTGVVLLNSHPTENGSGTRVAALPMAGPGFGGGLVQVAF